MPNFLSRMSYAILIPVAVLLGLAPFVPQPHLVEKVRMLLDGTLQRPIDIFDLLLHSAPAILLLIKGLSDLFNRSRRAEQ